jgi:hypothetical protein
MSSGVNLDGAGLGAYEAALKILAPSILCRWLSVNDG